MTANGIGIARVEQRPQDRQVVFLVVDGSIRVCGRRPGKAGIARLRRQTACGAIPLPARRRNETFFPGLLIAAPALPRPPVGTPGCTGVGYFLSFQKLAPSCTAGVIRCRLPGAASSLCGMPGGIWK